MELFVEIGLLIGIAAVFALILNKLNAPPLIAYVLTGILAGYLGLRPESEVINAMIEIGIILLLFLAGLEIKLSGVLKVGKKALLVGEGHDLIMAIVGFIIAFFLFQFDVLASFYLAIGITLSSTIVVVKALTNRKEVASPHGKILVGTMILQDIAAMVALAVFSSIGTQSSLLWSIIFMFAKGVLIFLILYVAGRFILPKVFDYAATSLELLFLVALGWCFAGVGLSSFLGFSTAIGAFLAALAIADLPFSFEITDKVRGIRDFGILLLFLSVGLTLEITRATFSNWKIYLLIIFVLIFTPFITAVITGWLKFTKKEVFIMSMLPNQTSEFTLILVTFGLTAGHISTEIYTILTLVVIITITISSYLSENLNKMYKKFEHKLNFLEWKHAKLPEHLKKDLKNHVVIFGFGILGQKIAEYYKNKKDVIVVEWRPELLKTAKRYKCMILYGDAGDPDVWEEVSLNKADVIISTIGENQEDDINLMKWVNKKNPKSLSIVDTNFKENMKQLYRLGADYVLVEDILEWNDLLEFLKTDARGRNKIRKQSKKLQDA